MESTIFVCEKNENEQKIELVCSSQNSHAIAILAMV